MPRQQTDSLKPVARNRKAYHDYEVIETVEAGIELQGSEVKSVRAGRINLLDSYALCSGGQLFVHHLHISPFEHANRFNHDPYRKRKLLLHRRQIAHLSAEAERQNLALVPLSVFFRRQWVKIELGLCKGRKKYDKRQKIIGEESKRRLRNLMKSNARLSALLLALFLAAAQAPEAGGDRDGGTGGTQPPARDSREFVPVPSLCGEAGMAWAWERASEKITCTGSSDIVVFTRDNCFVTVNDSVVQLARAPRAIGDTLYVASAEAAKVFDAVRKKAPDDRAEQPSPAGKKQEEGAGQSVAATPSAKGQHDRAGAAAAYHPQAIKTVVIDPGHGGKDPGAVGPNGVKEKDVVLAIALRLKKALEKSGMTVHCTRETDVFVPLKNRTGFANEKKADIFISIHANSIVGNQRKRGTVKGYKIYFLSQAKNEEDKRVAMLENSVIEMEEGGGRGDFLQNILIDMANNEYLAESEDMSIKIAESFVSGVPQVPSLHEGVGQAPFWVLNGAFMTSVLVETAFISNPEEEKLLSDNTFQGKVSDAIYRAVLNFKSTYEAGL